MSAFWAEFYRILQIRRKLSTARHPQTDGQTENANQFITQRLRPYIDYHQDDWSEWLPIVDLAAASLPSISTRKSPFFIERGHKPRISFDWTSSVPQELPGSRLAQEFAQQMEAV